MVMVKILGISGTVIKDGNCDVLVKEALKAAEESGSDVETRFITMADKEVAMCKHCQYCIENHSPCKIKDDAPMIFQAMEESDGIIMGGPTWCLTLAPPLINLASRARHIHFFTQSMRDKVGGGITLGWLGVGLEDALHALESVMMTWRLIRVGRAFAKSSSQAMGDRPDYMEHGVLNDTWGLSRVRALAKRVAEVARMIKFAKEQGITLSPLSKKEKVFVDGVWRDKDQE
jgi:multimeric flavodoxin WrbA